MYIHGDKFKFRSEYKLRRCIVINLLHIQRIQCIKFMEPDILFTILRRYYENILNSICIAGHIDIVLTMSMQSFVTRKSPVGPDHETIYTFSLQRPFGEGWWTLYVKRYNRAIKLRLQCGDAQRGLIFKPRAQVFRNYNNINIITILIILVIMLCIWQS